MGKITATPLPVFICNYKCFFHFSFLSEPRSERVPGGWLRLKEGDMRYLNIEAKTPTMVHGPMPFLSNLSFWDNLFGPIRPSTKEEL